MKFFAAPSEQFVDVSLVADVENKVILGRVKNVMHRQRELDHPEVRTEVSSGFREHGNQLFTDLLAKNFQLWDVEFFYIEWGIYRVQ